MDDKDVRFRGFTLIELLATIVVLAVIALITIPQVLNVIDNSKRESFRNSVSGIIRAVKQNYANDLEFDLGNGGLYYIIENGSLYLYDNSDNMINIPYNGDLKHATGKVIVQPDESIYATVDYSKWCAIKRYDSSEVEVYSINDIEKCHDELLNPTVMLVGLEIETEQIYTSGTWTENSVRLDAVTNSHDNDNYEYIWYRDGKIIDSAHDSSYTIDSDTESAEYSVAIRNSQGNIIKSLNNITVNIDKTNPICKINLSSVNEKNGWYTGNVIATLDTGSVFSGVKNYGINIGDNASYNSIKELTIEENGSYEVYGIVENVLGKSSTCYTSVNKNDVINFAVAINAVLEGTDTVYTSGTISTSNIILTGIVDPATNVSGYTYQWYKDNEKIENETNIQYKAISSGDYYLEVTAGNGIVKKSDSINLNIDTARPTCSLNVTSGTLGSNEWYTSDVVVGLVTTSAAQYGITTSSGVSYNGETSVTISNSSNVYCYVASESGLSTNSNNKMINIDKTAPTISNFSGTSVEVSGYNTTSLKLTAVASDVESEISKYEFYKIKQSSSEETLLGSNTTGIYTVTNPTSGYNYKVKVYNNAGLVSENTLTESCSLSTTGTCYSGTRTNIYTCTTGRQYSVTTSSECTTTPTGGSSGSCGYSGCQTSTYPCACNSSSLNSSQSVTVCYSCGKYVSSQSSGCQC